MHWTVRTGLIFPNWLKWVQGVLCYNQNWWKLKYLSGILTDLHQTVRTGLVTLSQSKWVQGVLCYDQKFNFGHAKSAIKIFTQFPTFHFLPGGGYIKFGHAKSVIRNFHLISNFSFWWEGGICQTLVMPNLPLTIFGRFPTFHSGGGGWYICR